MTNDTRDSFSSVSSVPWVVCIKQLVNHRLKCLHWLTATGNCQQVKYYRMSSPVERKLVWNKLARRQYERGARRGSDGYRLYVVHRVSVRVPR